MILIYEKLKNKQIILASQSPRRQELLQQMGLNFTVKPLHIDESYPIDLKKGKITEFITEKKSKEFGELSENQILITADTIVWHKGKCLEKPKDRESAIQMLLNISAEKHTVFTSISVRTFNSFHLKTDKAKVYFNEMSLAEIAHYVNNFKPYDKAGAYGIQDFLGLAKISKIKGSYFTVMGLPTHILYEILNEF